MKEFKCTHEVSNLYKFIGYKPEIQYLNGICGINMDNKYETRENIKKRESINSLQPNGAGRNLADRHINKICFALFLARVIKKESFVNIFGIKKQMCIIELYLKKSHLLLVVYI